MGKRLRLQAQDGSVAAEYVGFGAVIAAVIVVLFAFDPSLADRLRSPVDDQVCKVLRADCEGEDLPADDKVADRGGGTAGSDADGVHAELARCKVGGSGRGTRAFGSAAVLGAGLSTDAKMTVFADGTVELVLIAGADGSAGKDLKKIPLIPDSVELRAEAKGEVQNGYQYRFDKGSLDENIAAAEKVAERAHGDGLASRAWRLLPGTRDYDAPEQIGRVEKTVLSVGAKAGLRGDDGLVGGGLEGDFDTTVAYDEQAQEVSLTLEINGEMAGRLGDEFFARAAADAKHGLSYKVTYDMATGRPLSLTRSRTTKYGGGVDLGPEAAARVGGKARGHRVTTEEQHLDLRDPAAREAFDQAFFSHTNNLTGPVVVPKGRFGPLHEQFQAQGLELRQQFLAAEGGLDNDWIVLGGHDLHSYLDLEEATFVDYSLSAEPQPWTDCFN